MNPYKIREIRPEDNPVIERIIKDTFPEFDLPLKGTAFEDRELANMYAAYQEDRGAYFVFEEHGQVVGGGGIRALKGLEGDTCELQKMYLIPAVRGKGYGRLLFEHCMAQAREMGYRSCYLESSPEFKQAIRLYENAGFRHLDERLGNTGHYACGVWMTRDL